MTPDPTAFNTNDAPPCRSELAREKPKSTSAYLNAPATNGGFAITDDGSLSVCNL